jgi:hypothetical protein
MMSRRWKFARSGKLVAAAVLSASFCAAHAQEAKEQARTAAIADALSTAAGLAAGGVEMNPLGPVLAIGMKTVTFHFASSLPDTQQPAVYAAAAAMWSGAAANNVCVTAALLTGGSFGPACLVLGVAWGVKTWNGSEPERQFWAGCAMLREYAQLPALPCVYTPQEVQLAQAAPAVVLAQELTAP